MPLTFSVLLGREYDEAVKNCVIDWDLVGIYGFPLLGVSSVAAVAKCGGTGLQMAHEKLPNRS